MLLKFRFGLARAGGGARCASVGAIPAFAGMTGKTVGGLVLMLGLGGCGFAPLYGGAAGGDVAAQLEQVKIADIPDRTGQLLQQSLEAQMQIDGAPVSQLYLLSVNYNIDEQGVGIQQDTSTTRNRFVATAKWTLAPIGQPNTVLVKGQATTEDAENIIDNQYFTTELEGSTVDRQLADEIAGQITGQVAVWFRAHPAG